MTAWELRRHDNELGLAQLAPADSVPSWAYSRRDEGPLWSVTRTPEELSILCDWADVPGTVHSVGPLTVFSVEGPLDHALTGVLAGLLEPLAAHGVSILAHSTYDTDWILVPTAQADEAVRIWTDAGHTISAD
ncbi:ACT domain-containing protein [Propionibacteriaceae bacterium Y1685]|uniref:ACT domain-containing protein n=1 Tax=Microlunatus sp. Y1700 TaxID=3418487 RepID=UPI003B785B17